MKAKPDRSIPHNRQRRLLAALLLLSLNSAVSADDTEIFFPRGSDDGLNNRPNILLLINSSLTMGAGIQQVSTGTVSQPQDHFDPSNHYPGNQNINGGTGSEEYYYLYQRQEQSQGLGELVYFNRVHRDQLRCELSPMQLANPPYHSIADNYIFDSSSGGWDSIDWLRSAGDPSLTRELCTAFDPLCAFTSGPQEPAVDCRSQSKTVPVAEFPSTVNSPSLLAVTSNYHNYLQGYYRYSALQTALRHVVDKNYPVNIALMKFNNGDGGYIAQPAVAADDASGNSQRALHQVIDSSRLTLGTPLTESLWEAWLYLSGGTAYFGSAGNSTAFASGSDYRSPLVGSCQSSKIVIIGAGAPSLDGDNDNTIMQLMGTEHCGTDNSCADDFSQWLRRDRSQRRDHSAITGMQTIDVDVIELGSEGGLPLFKRIADGGNYLQATTSAQLELALRQSIETTAATTNSYVPAAVPVANYQSIELDNELYFALFQPSHSQRWNGNIKKYRLRGGEIVDSNGRSAIDADSGFFADDALSLWSRISDWQSSGKTSADGAFTQRGGFAYRLEPGKQRRIYSYIGPSPGVGNSAITLGDTFLLHESNHNIDPIALGLDPSSGDWQLQRQQIIRWANGEDPSANHYSGDFIHGRPVVVNYRRDPECSESELSRCVDNTIFAPSNLGFMYAIDGTSGDEIFAFIPQELLPNLGHYYRNDAITTAKKYGLDAPINLWRQDRNNNGQIDPEDHVYLYLAMRRGGDNYYALNVSDRSSPQLLWQIDGGEGAFRDLAQTWSVPKKAKVRWHCGGGNCLYKDVLFFGGGYDTIHDGATTATSGDRGNAIYMVDASTGELLWSAGKGAHHSLPIPHMENSIPADLSVSDVDGDGYSELIIAVDIQGNVWRFDIDAAPSDSANFAVGGKIAALGGDGRGFRRFYNAPDVAFFSLRGERAFLSISLSSGYRASPNSSEIDDRLFVLYDYHPLSRPEDELGVVSYNYSNHSTVLRAADLGNIDNGSASIHGWYKALTGAGEKGLSPTVTFDSKILMSTFIPAQGCNDGPGDSRIYVLDALTGASRHPDNIPFQTLDGSGIAPQPLVIATLQAHCSADCDSPTPQLEQRSVPLVCIGTHCRDDLLHGSVHKTYWRENQ